VSLETYWTSQVAMLLASRMAAGWGGRGKATPTL